LSPVSHQPCQSREALELLAAGGTTEDPQQYFDEIGFDDTSARTTGEIHSARGTAIAGASSSAVGSI
jgi:hypothetical protein